MFIIFTLVNAFVKMQKPNLAQCNETFFNRTWEETNVQIDKDVSIQSYCINLEGYNLALNMFCQKDSLFSEAKKNVSEFKKKQCPKDVNVVYHDEMIKKSSDLTSIPELGLSGLKKSNGFRNRILNF